MELSYKLDFCPWVAVTAAVLQNLKHNIYQLIDTVVWMRPSLLEAMFDFSADLKIK